MPNTGCRVATLSALVIALVTGCGGVESESSAEAAAAVTDDVAVARTAVSEGRFQDAAVLLKRVLLDSPPDAQASRDALVVVDSIYEKNAGQAIPVDFQIPESL